ncbi:hypothetical protein ACE4ZU_26690, partial [Salmonella enterica]|uniref:hypothetical protein n=1 Tax=Salmonella enterica TaxID=28901 RepID=UPI003D2DA993
KYSFFLDDQGLNYIPTPKNVTNQGLYYVKAENAAGCNDIKPISVLINPVPAITTATSNVLVCRPIRFDITDSSLLKGYDTAYKFS